MKLKSYLIFGVAKFDYNEKSDSVLMKEDLMDVNFFGFYPKLNLKEYNSTNNLRSK